MDKQVSILFVNTDIQSLEVLEQAVRELPVRVVPVASWDEAAQRIQDTELALIVVDNRMCHDDSSPCMTGFKKAHEQVLTPVLFLLMDKALGEIPPWSGIIDWIENPSDRLRLQSKIQLFCELFTCKKELHTVSRKLSGFVRVLGDYLKLCHWLTHRCSPDEDW